MKGKKIYLPVLVGFIMFVTGIIYVKYSVSRPTSIQVTHNSTNTPLFEEEIEDTSIQKTTSIESEEEMVYVVHIAGAVHKPNVYTLPSGSRVYEVIELAGGATEDADLAAINLAMKIKDEQKIYIPRIGETFDKTEKENNNSISMQLEEENMHKININTASGKELEELPGIGPVTAESIIQYREENGRFQKIEDIQKVSRIGPKTFEKIKMKITVD